MTWNVEQKKKETWGKKTIYGEKKNFEQSITDLPWEIKQNKNRLDSPKNEHSEKQT